MRLVTREEYLDYIREHDSIVIEDQVVPLKPITIDRLEPDEDEDQPTDTTVWSFPKRGSWATHKGDYRGNWAPQIPRALIQMYSNPGEVVLDQMVGSGTTCIEARLLGRNCIGIDINYAAIMLSHHRLYYLEEYAKNNPDNEWSRNVLSTWTKLYHGDARNLEEIEDESIDLIATHPPYFNIIRYTKKVEGDLSKTRKLEEYLSWMSDVAREAYRVLKPGRYCAVLIGDTRIRRHYVPISHYVLRVFLKQGFILKEEIIKIQHKMKTTREVWRKLKKRDFLLIYHEKLYVFKKPGSEEDLKTHKYSGFLEDIS
ncbi:methyltransferase domain-containing protein [Desulfurococcaceae archaeon MEX13E-LK6-19]|nr:methyltransferase domain-containing protein [Desulfurococcaceae archaeon MEX13E-LK6-19]